MPLTKSQKNARDLDLTIKQTVASFVQDELAETKTSPDERISIMLLDTRARVLVRDMDEADVIDQLKHR